MESRDIVKNKLVLIIGLLFMMISHDSTIEAAEFNSSTSAGLAADQAMLQIQSLAAEVKTVDDGILNLNHKIKRSFAEKANLEDEKEKALAELRQGYFCSKCNRSKTEIERAGEDFYEHLKRVGGHIVPASQEQIYAKEKEYNDKILAKVNELGKLEKQKEGIEKKRLQIVGEIDKAMSEWINAVKAEGNLLDKEWQQQKNDQESNIKNFQELYNARDREQQEERGKKKPDQRVIDGLEAQKHILLGGLTEAEKNLNFLNDAYQLNKASWDDKVRKGRSALSDAAAVAGIPDISGVTPLYNIPGLEIHGGFLNFSLSNDKIGLGAGFGDHFYGSIDISSDWLNSQQNLKIILEGNVSGIGSAGIGMKQDTTWGPGGVTITNEPIIRGSIMDIPAQDLLEGGKKDETKINSGTTKNDKNPIIP